MSGAAGDVAGGNFPPGAGSGPGISAAGAGSGCPAEVREPGYRPFGARDPRDRALTAEDAALLGGEK